MSKRDGGSIRRSNPKVRKRNGVKIRTVMVPESDEEDPPSNVNTDYARLVQTRVTPSGKIGSITTSSIPLLETDDTADNVLLEPVDTDCIGETAVEDMPTIPTTQKKRKKANDSVCCIQLFSLPGLADSLSDKNAVLARHTIHRAR